MGHPETTELPVCHSAPDMQPARRHRVWLYNPIMALRAQKKAPTAKAAGTLKERGQRLKSPAKGGEKPEVRIFVSYSHKDTTAREKLHTHLAPWRRDGVTVWYDENIDPGAELDPEIARELRRAHIFVALFSPAYLDSNYCWNIEYKRAMSRRARKLVRVVGVVVKPCGWKQTRAAGFKLLPKDGLPPERWSSSDAAFVTVAEGIGGVIKSARRELAAKPATRSRGASKPKRKSTPPRATPPNRDKPHTKSAAKPAKPLATSSKLTTRR